MTLVAETIVLQERKLMLAGSLSGDFGHFGFSSCLCSVVCFIEKRVAVSFKE